MPRQIFRTTAEHTIRVVEAVHFSLEPCESDYVENFCGLSTKHISNALALATDMMLISKSGNEYSASHPLTRYFLTSEIDQKVSLLRIVIESYDVFVTFRKRYMASESLGDAVRQTMAALSMNGDQDELQATLIDLGTFTGAIVPGKAGEYEFTNAEIISDLNNVSEICNKFAAAERWVCEQLGEAAETVSHNDVIIPLANAALKALDNKPDDAVTGAGNAFESYLAELAGRMDVSFGHASGIISKIDKFKPDDKLPKKLVEASKYIGQVRNAAGHGIDDEVGANWIILPSTGINIVQVVCAMIRACHEREHGTSFTI